MIVWLVNQCVIGVFCEGGYNECFVIVCEIFVFMCCFVFLLVVCVIILLFGVCVSIFFVFILVGLKIVVDLVVYLVGEILQWWYCSGVVQVVVNGVMFGKVKNVILFFGDGMSLIIVVVLCIYEGQCKGGFGEENLLLWECFLVMVFSKIYNIDLQILDLVGIMIVIMIGVKIYMGVIGVSVGSCIDCVDSLFKGLLIWLQLVDSVGLVIGVVFIVCLIYVIFVVIYVYLFECNWENDIDLIEVVKVVGCKDIVQQLLLILCYGWGLLVVLGGGCGEFIIVEECDLEYDDKVGQCLDGCSLVQEWQQVYLQGVYVWNSRQLVVVVNVLVIFGLFELDYMCYEYECLQDLGGELSLVELMVVVIRNLLKYLEGYVLMIEGVCIDYVNYSGNVYCVLIEIVVLFDVVCVVNELILVDDILIIVIVDYLYMLNFVGYLVCGNLILGKVKDKGGEDGVGKLDYVLDGIGQLYIMLSYVNGLGYIGSSNQQLVGLKCYLYNLSSFELVNGCLNLCEVDIEYLDYMQEVLVLMKFELYGGEDVGIWVCGLGSKVIRGMLEQNVIYYMIVQVILVLCECLCQVGICDDKGVLVQLLVLMVFECKVEVK